MKIDKKILRQETNVKTAKNPTEFQIKKMINECEKSPCLLCGGIPYKVGVFSPTDSNEYGARPGRAKQFFYSICKDCVDKDDSLNTIENAFKVLEI